ncbi:MAG: DHH family phosphoesterase [Bacteroidales bacterium]|nr:DHH family phosphoesterase [Bacteroidales bacterium]
MITVTEEKIKAFLTMVSKSESIVLITHFRPDGDALGSTFALRTFLKDVCRHDSTVILSSGIPESLLFIPSEDDKASTLTWDGDNGKAIDVMRTADLVICLDCANLGRCDELGDYAISSKAEKVLIDHHLNPDTDQFDLVFSESDCVSSASELLYYILLATPQIDGDAARIPEAARRSMMAGMTTDTNNFANSVHPTTLRMASELIASGTDRDEILGHIYNEYRENRFRAMGFLLSERLVISDKGIAYIIVDQATRDRFDLREGETEGIVNMPLGIKSVNISIMLTEDGDRYRVSVRSKRGWSANNMAIRYFNGGGHEQAAGGRLYIGKDIADSSELPGYLERIISES